MGRGFFGSSVLSLTARNGQVYVFEFRTSEKAHAAHTMILNRVLEPAPTDTFANEPGSSRGGPN
jgi:hypothetical protein